MLKQLLKEKNISQKELSEKAGIDKINLNRIVNGKINNVRKSTIDKLASALEVEADYLENLIKRSGENSFTDNTNYQIDSNIVYIPLRGCRMTTHFAGSQYISNIEDEKVSILSSNLPESLPLKDLFAITVLSDKEKPELYENDLLIVNPNWQSVNENKVYIILTENRKNEVAFCRLKVHHTGIASIKTFNPKAKDFNMMTTVLHRIVVGEVVYLSRKY